MTRILVTGATGFVGTVLCDVLEQAGHVVHAAVRNRRPMPTSVTRTTVVGDIDATTQWQDALRDVDAVIHTAARVHVMHGSAADSDLYFETNARGTARLAQEAARVGVRRMVFLSSVKVNGDESGGKPYAGNDLPRPTDPYGESKLAAERSLQEIAAQTGMEAVSIRPPLVYGPGVRANFLRLMGWVDRQRPLPFGSVHNKRSLVNVWNLCDLLANVLTNEAACGRAWMVSDGEDLSTPELVRRIARSMNKRARLLPVPAGALQLAGALTGKRAEVARLCGSLTVDLNETRTALGWSPPVAVDDALERTARWYFQRRAD